MIEQHKIAVITPTRGDRPLLLDQCKHYVDRQTIKVKHFVIEEELGIEGVDLTQRIYLGLKRAKEEGFRYIFIMEDDDWYHPEYIESFINNIKINDKIALYGINYTNYCHIKWDKRWYVNHIGHTSLFCSMIDVDLFPIERLKELPSYKEYNGSLDWELFKEKRLGRSITTVLPLKQIGIKHGIGKLGGHGHTTEKIYHRRFGTAFDFLQQHLNDDDLDFYKKLIQQ